MSNRLTFISTGGAFSKDNKNNAAYYKVDNKLVLLDCGETVFHDILNQNIITEDIKRIDVIITHFHSDHVGSLGSLVFFCRYKKIEANIIFPIKSLPKQLLDIFGIEEELYNLKEPQEINDYYIKEYKQLHGDLRSDGTIIPMESYGYHIKDKNINIYYSGDTTTLHQEVLEKFNSKEIEYIYHEITTDGYKAHFPIEKLEKLIDKEQRDRVYCMHMGDNTDIAKIKKLGFRSVR